MGVRVGPVVLVGGCLVMGGPAGPAGPPQSRLPLVGASAAGAPGLRDPDAPTRGGVAAVTASARPPGQWHCRWRHRRRHRRCRERRRGQRRRRPRFARSRCPHSWRRCRRHRQRPPAWPMGLLRQTTGFQHSATAAVAKPRFSFGQQLADPSPARSSEGTADRSSIDGNTGLTRTPLAPTNHRLPAFGDRGGRKASVLVRPTIGRPIPGPLDACHAATAVVGEHQRCQSLVRVEYRHCHRSRATGPGASDCLVAELHALASGPAGAAGRVSCGDRRGR